MQKVIIVIAIISILINILLGYILYNKKSEISNSDNYIEKIDSLELEISYLKNRRDSIRVLIDTTFVQIENNNSKYEEVYNTIVDNTVDEDLLFFTEYLEQYIARLDSINNF